MVNGFGSLILLLFLSALPVLVAYLWFSLRKYPYGILWFLCALLAGIVSLLIAAFLQGLFPVSSGTGFGSLLFRLFVKIALTEEGGRLLALAVFFIIGRRWPRIGSGESPSHGAATGLVAGLGFAFIENASYAAADIQVAVIRGLMAAPLHGGCGARVGMTAAALCSRRPGSLKNFVLAVLIHGMYNFLIIHPGIPAFVPLIVSFASLISAVYLINMRNRQPRT
ncbi:PrsW family glutamic-type intramembrane protease [Breznakiella homolactica]|uniref:PrsW family intramembrane metalloprotease n=1 Tax=Breznakiella homolactica TaxID=2798577 RepID=A0A7T8BAP3_9SPIR|nr:PrsW family glutamic-type intramembrane protease [Breznakiella homolactica]QQO09591.1 PrsW family intramembrane metalloprotease [Breznakiella homolactica]